LEEVCGILIDSISKREPFFQFDAKIYLPHVCGGLNVSFLLKMTICLFLIKSNPTNPFLLLNPNYDVLILHGYVGIRLNVFPNHQTIKNVLFLISPIK
jgi:hypothetical protein